MRVFKDKKNYMDHIPTKRSTYNVYITPHAKVEKLISPQHKKGLDISN